MFDNPKQAADFLGVSLDTIYSWEAGRRQPRGVTQRLLDILDTLEQEQPALLALLIKQHAPVKTKLRLSKIGPRRLVPGVIPAPREPEQEDSPPQPRLLSLEALRHRDAAGKDAEPIVYTWDAFASGEYNHLFPTMDDAEYDAFVARLT